MTTGTSLNSFITQKHFQFAGYLLCFILVGFISACSNDGANPTSESGAIDFAIEMPTTIRNKSMSRAVAEDCGTFGIDTIEISVFDESGEEIAAGGPWSCRAPSGTVKDVPPGSGIKIVVLCKDADGNVIYRGEKADISVYAGETAHAGTIESFSFIPSFIVPGIVVDGEFRIEIKPVPGAVRYYILVSENENLRDAIEREIAGTIVSITGLKKDAIYFWQVTAIDSNENKGAKSDVFEADSHNDTDRDGIHDGNDNCPTESNPEQTDSDNDKIGNICDSCPNDPHNDADNDGVCGDEDRCQGHDDRVDADNDGISDGCDSCDNRDDDNDNVPNCQDSCSGHDDAVDLDGDGIPDGCDDCDNRDNDNDGVPNCEDLCPGHDDTKDLDEDNIPDECDECDNRDDDYDTVANCNDICQGHDDNADIDQDGIPDGCDDCIDVDGDDTCISLDNCPDIHNPDQSDFDKDGLGDACDTDADGDGYDGTYFGGNDCNDRNADINPGMPEMCNGIDDNCNNQTDDNVRWYVDPGKESGDGQSWENPFNSIQDAIYAASGDSGCTEIWIREGIYEVSNYPIEIYSNIQLYGGFPDNMASPDWNDRDWKTNPSEIIATGNTRCLHIEADAIVDGFTITGPIISTRMISSEEGGIIIEDSDPLITNCSFIENKAIKGGAIANYDSEPTITNCTFFTNSATKSGGAIYNQSSAPIITNCSFSGNGAYYGGAIFNEASSPRITNCILWGNTASIKKMTEIYNADKGSNPDVNFSNVMMLCGATYPGTGNINIDPQFEHPENGDFHVKPDSPCINNGSSDESILPETDFEGDKRIINGIVDMGADEFIGFSISGVLLHNEKPMSEVTPRIVPSFWFLNVETMQIYDDGSIEWKYDTETGRYEIRNLPRTCLIAINFWVYNEKGTLPGNFGTLAPWNFKMSRNYDIEIYAIMHMIKPFDNTTILKFPKISLQSYPLPLFEWESISNANHYNVTIFQCHDEDYSRIKKIHSGDYKEPQFLPELKPLENKNEHYEMNITAYQDRNLLGSYIATYDTVSDSFPWGFDLGYRFKISNDASNTVP